MHCHDSLTQEARDQIELCYQRIGVFLLPHPGKEVTRQTFDGSLEKVDPEFLRFVGFYVEHIFLNALRPKLINNDVLFADDFEAYSDPLVCHG